MLRSWDVADLTKWNGRTWQLSLSLSSPVFLSLSPLSLLLSLSLFVASSHLCFSGRVTPVVWDYTASLSQVSDSTWGNYNATFGASKNIWAASAYKGATNKEADVPNMYVFILPITYILVCQSHFPSSLRSPPPFSSHLHFVSGKSTLIITYNG